MISQRQNLIVAVDQLTRLLFGERGKINWGIMRGHDIRFEMEGRPSDITVMSVPTSEWLRVFDQGDRGGPDTIGLLSLVAQLAGYDFDMADAYTGTFTPRGASEILAGEIEARSPTALGARRPVHTRPGELDEGPELRPKQHPPGGPMQRLMGRTPAPGRGGRR
jgi:hypothetical protein